MTASAPPDEELKLAERDHRHVRRHLPEARLPPGKTPLDSFDFAAVPRPAVFWTDAWDGSPDLHRFPHRPN